MQIEYAMFQRYISIFIIARCIVKTSLVIQISDCIYYKFSPLAASPMIIRFNLLSNVSQILYWRHTIYGISAANRSHITWSSWCIEKITIVDRHNFELLYECQCRWLGWRRCMICRKLINHVCASANHYWIWGGSSTNDLYLINAI